MQGPTWQQAVQYIPEVPLKEGDRYTVTAKHDTYGLSFSLQPEHGTSTSVTVTADASGSAASPVPLYVRSC